MVAVTFVALDPAVDVEPLVEFLAANTFPFHRGPRLTLQQAREVVGAGRFWSGDSVGWWVRADGERIGVAVIDDLEDVADGGNPIFEVRFEGHTRDDNLAMRSTLRRAGWVKEAFHRDAWPVDGGPPRSSVAYAVLRRDWRSGTTTPVVWDDL
jgi:hypothetical protein